LTKEAYYATLEFRGGTALRRDRAWLRLESWGIVRVVARVVSGEEGEDFGLGLIEMYAERGPRVWMVIIKSGRSLYRRKANASSK
jgi:hypothetical protein